MDFVHSVTRIKKLIVHEIPKKGTGRPVLSDIESPLDDDVRAYFEERVASALTGGAYPIEFVSTFPKTRQATEAYLGKDIDFVAFSKRLAEHLFDVQTGVNSPGLLCVASCRNDGHRCVAILKLEKEEGLRVQEDMSKGRKTLSVTHVRDLMLGNRTRVFKVALIARIDDELVAWASDQQRPGTESVANFFLLHFLGARLVTKPEVLTRDFMDAVEHWIKVEVPDAETKSRYQVALMAEMSSHRTAVTPSAFAAEHVDPPDRESLFAHLRQAEAPDKRFPKNIALVRNRLRKVQYDLDGQISVSCPPDQVDKGVRLRSLDNSGKVLIEAEGKLRNLRGKQR
jgi:hypothetical protein